MAEFTLAAFADEIHDSLDVQMDVLQSHGIRHIEMRGVNGRSLVDHSLDEVRVIKAQMERRGFRVAAVGSPIGKIGIVDDFPPHLQLFEHTLDIARVLEAPFIRMFSFYIPRGDDPAGYRGEVLSRWNAFVEKAYGREVTLLHENEKGIYGDTAERCLDLLASLGCDYVGATFDPANFVQCDEVVYPQAYETLQEQIRYVHIKDARYRDYQVVPSGVGDGKIKELLTALKDAGYRGFLSLEPHLGSFSGLASLELDLDTSGLPEGGPGLFAVAVEALQGILAEVMDDA